MTNNEFAKLDKTFKDACKGACVEPTPRQAGKFRNKKGVAYSYYNGRFPTMSDKIRDRLKSAPEEQKNKFVKSYCDRSTARRGAKRMFGDNWENSHNIEKLEDGRHWIVEKHF